MNPQLLLLTLFLTSGGLLVFLSIPLILHKVPPNPWYGFRVRRTLEDPNVWYPANAYSAWYLLALGAAIMLAALVAYFVDGLDVASYGTIVGIVAGIGMIAMLVQSFRYLRRSPDKKQ